MYVRESEGGQKEERETARKRQEELRSSVMHVYIYISVCVARACLCVCVCAGVREKWRESGDELDSV